MNILHIDSSITGANSVSRLLSAAIVTRQQTLHPGARVTYRDLVVDAVPHLAGPALAILRGGAAAPAPAPGSDDAKGAAYLDELLAADLIVIGAPMYNFSIPSQLKGWIDRVCVPGRTFRYGDNGVEGLLKGKKLLIASARGGIYSGDAPFAVLDHQETYLRGMLGFLGLNDVTVIRAEGINLGPEAKAGAIAAAHTAIDALAA